MARRVLEEVLNQVARCVGVDHDDDRSATQDAEEGTDEIRAVRKRHDHAFLRANVVGGEQVRILRRQPRDVRIRQGAAAGTKSGTSATALDEPRIEHMRRQIEARRYHGEIDL